LSGVIRVPFISENQEKHVMKKAGPRGVVTLVSIVMVAGLSCTDHGLEPVSVVNVESLFAVNDDGKVTLGWTGWEDGFADEIEVHRSLSPTFEPTGQTFYQTVGGSATRFEDANVANGTVYFYRILPYVYSPEGDRLRGQASNVAIGRPYDYSAIGEISYSSHIQPIFNSTCAVPSCHVGYDSGASKAHSLAKVAHGGQFSLLSWEDLFQGSVDGSVAIPYFSQKSDLIFHVNSDTLVAPIAVPHMPLPDFNLPASQVAALIRWIDEGAKNDAGEVPYSVTPQGKMFVVCSAEDLIAVIDVETNLLIRYVNVSDPSFPFGSPHHVKSDARGEYFYVTLIGAQQLWKFSASTYERIATLNIPFQPADLVLTGSGDTAYVSCFGSADGRVTVVDTRTMTIIRNVYNIFAVNPHGIVRSHDGTRIFVGNAGSGTLTQINGDFSTSLITMDTLGYPFGSSVSPYLLDLTPDDRYLYVTDYAQGARNVYVVDLVLDATKPSRAIPVGGRSVHVAITPDGSSAWVCNLSMNSVNVINTADFSVRTMSNVGKQPHGIAFTPDGKKAYVTTENTFDPDPPHHPSSGSAGVSYVYVFDGATLQIINVVEVGAFAQGIAYAP
jgi:DNA-binding beta-propeller fold protein YncE